MNIKKTSILLIVALSVYFGFDAYIGWLVYSFSLPGVLVRLYLGMVAINVIGVYAYSSIGNDFLGITDALKWLEAEKGKLMWFRRAIRKNRWLSFVALSVLPCPMAGYYFANGNIERRPYKVLSLIGLGSIPCTLVWGGGPSLIWNSVLRWPAIIAIATYLGWLFAAWLKKHFKKGGECHDICRPETD